MEQRKFFVANVDLQLTLRKSGLLVRASSLLDSVNNVKYFGGNVVTVFGGDFFAICEGAHQFNWAGLPAL